MKSFHIFTVVFLLFGTYFINAQDLIVLKNGNIIDAKVTELSRAEIRYLRYNHLDGPVNVIPMTDVLSIRYENGNYEILNNHNLNLPAGQESIIEEEHKTENFSPNWFIGGNLSFRFFGEQDRSSYGIYNIENITSEFSPVFGFIINNKFDMGFNLLVKTEYADITTFGIGAFTRYSFFTIEKFSILGHFGINYLYSPFGVNQYGEYYYRQQRILKININPLLQYKLLDNLSIYTSIGALYFSFPLSNDFYEDNNQYILYDIGLNFSTDITLGFNILFDSSKSKNKKANNRESAQTENSAIPQLGAATTFQQGLNQLPAVPIFGKNLKFEFGGDTWIAKVNGQNFMAGNCVFEEKDNGYILKLETTNVWSGAIEEVIDLLQKIGVPLGPAAGPLRTAGRLAASIAKWIPLKGSSITLEYNEGPPASLRLGSR